MARDYTAIANQYCQDILDQTIPAGYWVQMACYRNTQDLEKSKETEYPYYYSPDRAKKVCRFIEMMYHTKSEWGDRREKIVLQPWQCFIITTAFGWLRKTDHRRRFVETDIIVPRKNGKSIIAAALALYMLVADGEYGAEIYSGATSEKQAYEVFTPALEMIRRNPAMSQHYGIQSIKTSINVPGKAAKFQPLVGKPGDGASPSFSVIDEYHEHATSIVYDTMRSGMGSRREPMIFVITTAGENLSSPCYDMVLDGRKLLENTLPNDERFFIEYGIDSEDDWAKPSVLRKANPNFDVSVFGSYLESRQKEGLRNVRAAGNFKTKHLNVWVQSKSAYFNIYNWNQGCILDNKNNPKYHENSPELQYARCKMGLDLASKQDITALCLLFPQEDGSFITLQRFYLPENILELQGNEHYRKWASEDKLILTPGNMIDQEYIRDDVREFTKKFQVESIVFDPQMASWMMGNLYQDGSPVIQMTQNANNLSEPMKYLAAIIDEKRIYHNSGESDPMTWMMSNVISKPNIRDQDQPHKDRPESKIDGPVALMMAMSQCLFDQNRSIYESEDIAAW